MNVMKSESESTETVQLHDATLSHQNVNPVTPENLPSKMEDKEHSAPASSRFGNNRPAVESQVKVHPFVLGRTERNETTTKISHPFLSQIKTTTPSITTTTTMATVTQENIATTTKITATTTARPSLFSNRNRKRPSLFPSLKSLKTTVNKKTAKTQDKSKSFLKGLKARLRLSHFKQPKSTIGSNKIDKIQKGSTADTINITETNKTKLSSLITKPNYSHSKVVLSPLTPREVPVSSSIEKPRSKRLPAPFTGARNSLFRNRHKAPSILTTTTTTTTENVETTSSFADSLNTEKLTVEEFIAEVNGENKDEPSNLRINSFKPKESGSVIRKKLIAELAKKKESNDGSIDSSGENSSTTLSTTTISDRHFSRASLLRERISQNNRKKAGKHDIFSGSRQRSRSRVRAPTFSTTNAIQDTSTSPTVVSQLNNDTKDILHNLVSVDNMHGGKISSFVTPSPFQALEDPVDDMTHDLVSEHHPEIHFRHLQPDLLPADPLIPPQAQLSETTTESAILPTTLSAGTFLSTLGTITTIQEQETTLPSRDTRRRFLGRRRNKNPSSNAATQKERRPSVRPSRTRSRSRSRRVNNKPDSSETPRSSGASRRFNPRNRVDAPTFKGASTGPRGRRRRIKGRARSTSPAPRSTESTTLQTTETMLEAEDVTTSQPAGKGKTVIGVVSNFQDITTVIPDEVDTLLTVFSGQGEEGDMSTSRPRTFMPKVSSQAIRFRLQQNLIQKKTKDGDNFGSQATDGDVEKTELNEDPKSTDIESSNKNDSNNIHPNSNLNESSQNKGEPRREGRFNHGLTHKRPNFRRTPSSKQNFFPTPNYDPRLKRQNGVTEASIELYRAGRSTISTQGFTENPLRPDIQEPSETSLINRIPISVNEIKESSVRPFLLRGGKGERRQFGDRYVGNKEQFIPEKRSKGQVSGPNPSNLDVNPSREKDKNSVNSILIPALVSKEESQRDLGQYQQKIFLVHSPVTDEIRQVKVSEVCRPPLHSALVLP